VVSLQKSAGRVLASNKLARSAPKRVAVRVNGGLAGAGVGAKASGSVPCERVAGVSAFTATPCGIGEGPAKTQDDVRASSSGCLTQPKAVRQSRDRGHKGHRIL